MDLSVRSSVRIQDACYSVGIDAGEILVLGSTGYSALRINEDQTTKQVKLTEYQRHARPTAILALLGQEQRSQSDIAFVFGSVDGNLHFCAKNGSIARTIKGHDGAILTLACPQDGSFLVSGGEEGLIKIWSRNGALKAVLAESSAPIFSAVCGPGSKQVTYSSGKNIILHNINGGSNSLLKGHWKQVNTLSWSAINKHLLSGSDDGTYILWNATGDCVYKSKPSSTGVYHVTWNPRGKHGLVVTAVDVLLIDQSGTELSRTNLENTSHVEWSLDGLQAFCSRGDEITIMSITGKSIKTRHQEAKQVQSTRLVTTELTMDGSQVLEFTAPIADFNLAYGYLVVATTIAAHIYSSINWHLVATMDTKRAGVNLVLISHKYTSIFGSTGLQLYSLDGKSIGSTSWSLPYFFDEEKATLSSSLLALIDATSDSAILYTDIDSNKKIPERLNNYYKYKHKRPVKMVAAEPASIRARSTIAFLDHAKELYVLTFAGKLESGCFATNVELFCWHRDFDTIAMVSDKTLHVWGNVQTVPTSIQHLLKPLFTKSLEERSFKSISYTDEEVTLTQADFSDTHHVIPHFVAEYVSLISTRSHGDLLRLCGQTEEVGFWSNLAVYALLTAELKLAEVALTNVGDYVTLYYVKHLQKMQDKDELRAELAMLTNDTSTAESIYLGNSTRTIRAVDVNLFSGKWKRAKEVAKKCGNEEYLERIISKIIPNETDD